MTDTSDSAKRPRINTMTVAVSLSPLPVFQFNQGGVPLAGGLLFTYIAGSTTKLATYQDSAGNTPNTNPIVLDANGQCVLYLQTGLNYKLTLSPATDTDPPTNPYWTEDNIYNNVVSALPYADATGSSDVITASYLVANPVLSDGYPLLLDIGTPNTTTTPTFAPTLDGILQTARTIVKSVANVNTPLAVGDLQGVASLIYDSGGLVWVLQNPTIVSAAYSVSRAYTTGGTSTAYTITPTPAITAYAANQTYDITFNQASGASPTISISGVATPPNLVYQKADGTYVNIGSGQIPTGWQSTVKLISPTQALVTHLYVTQEQGDNSTNPATTAFADGLLRSYLAGLGMSTAGSSTTMSIAAGQAMDSTNTSMLKIAAFTKTTSSWTLGTAGGALDTGTTGGAASTWYYWYLIRRPDTGVVDLTFSLSSSLPALPANYTQYRYIGAGLLDGGKNWTAFTQMGREFWWSTPILEGGATFTGSATAALITCTIPLGRKMKGIFNLSAGSNNNTGGIYISDPANADLAPSTSAAPLMTAGATNAVSTPGSASGQAACWTNTSAQIRHRELVTSVGYGIATLGWIDLADTNL